jgi:predicted DNA-binding transcriptional regulator YafY
MGFSLVQEQRAIERRERIKAFFTGQVVTAAAIADQLGLCERTVYRHIVALKAEGFPIVGEAGVGYVLREERNG